MDVQFARRSSSATIRWTLQSRLDARQTYTGLPIDTADQIAVVEALCQSLPDPTLFRDKIDRLKKRLEEFEELMFNPQDKAEILGAIAARPNTAHEMDREMARKAG